METKYNIFRLLSISLTCVKCNKALEVYGEPKEAEYIDMKCPSCGSVIRMNVHCAGLSKGRGLPSEGSGSA
jgi:phage FluMu protein Com